MVSDKKLESEAKRFEALAIDCVFPTSAKGCATMLGIELSDYFPKGVEAYEQHAHHDGGRQYPNLSARAGLAMLCEQLGAKVIVDVRPGIIPYHTGPYAPSDRVYLIGTALVPKTNTTLVPKTNTKK